MSFIQFDICDYYPNITPFLLNKALDFAAKYVEISDDDRNLFFHTRKTFLCSKDDYWIKKNNPEFDVSMGSFDSSEISDVCGLYILSLLEPLNIKNGLYRDDGVAYCTLTPRQAENMKKNICKIFKEIGFNITIEANLKEINFLDITFNIETGIYKPYMKENNAPIKSWE